MVDTATAFILEGSLGDPAQMSRGDPLQREATWLSYQWDGHHPKPKWPRLER